MSAPSSQERYCRERSRRAVAGALDPDYRCNVSTDDGSNAGRRKPKRYTVTRDECDKLIDRNRLDIELYAFAVHTFCRKHGCAPELLELSDPVEMVMHSGPTIA